MDDLTPRQRQVLRFIQDAVLQHGMPPTRAEIAEALAIPVNTVYSRLRAARADFERAITRLRSRDEWRVR